MRPIHYFFLALLAVPPVMFLSGGTDGRPLPPSYLSDYAINFPHQSAWDNAEKPFAPPGFKVTRFSSYLKNPRWLYVLPNGDVLAAESRGGPGIISADRITLLRDADNDGIAETKSVFLTGLKKPFGMALIGNDLYVANTDSLMRFPYAAGDLSIEAKGEKVIALPKSGANWTRSLLASPDGSKLYIGIGGGSQITDTHSVIADNRGSIVEISPDGTGEKTYTTNLSNPVGMDWNPRTHQLWAVVNQQSLEAGAAETLDNNSTVNSAATDDDMDSSAVAPPETPPADYLISVKEASIYGLQPNETAVAPTPANKTRTKPAAKTGAPPAERIYPLSGNVAALGFAFYMDSAFPSPYDHGAFIGEHGAWDKTGLTGFKVSYIPFENGKPAAPSQDFLTGFIKEKSKASIYGRPAGVAVQNGRLLVADDTGNIVWCVTYTGEKQQALLTHDDIEGAVKKPASP